MKKSKKRIPRSVLSKDFRDKVVEFLAEVHSSWVQDESSYKLMIEYREDLIQGREFKGYKYYSDKELRDELQEMVTDCEDDEDDDSYKILKELDSQIAIHKMLTK